MSTHTYVYRFTKFQALEVDLKVRYTLKFHFNLLSDGGHIKVKTKDIIFFLSNVCDFGNRDMNSYLETTITFSKEYYYNGPNL